MRKLLRSYDAETKKKMDEADEARAAKAGMIDPNTDVDTATKQRDDQEHAHSVPESTNSGKIKITFYAPKLSFLGNEDR